MHSSHAHAQKLTIRIAHLVDEKFGRNLIDHLSKDLFAVVRNGVVICTTTKTATYSHPNNYTENSIYIWMVVQKPPAM